MRSYSIILSIGLALLSNGWWQADSLAQGTPNFWNVPGQGDYASDSNWSAGGVPQANPYEERAVIDNGGTAFLSVGGIPIAGGIDVLNGTLEIRRGGSLATETATLATGTLTVGSGGHLIVGQLAGANAANLSVVADATIDGTLSIIGPNANFSAANIDLSGQLQTTVTTGGTTAIKTPGTATLSGPLQVNFSGVSPTIGTTYNIIDAGNILGSFSDVAISANLAPGLFLDYSTTSGGTHGTLGQVKVDAKLVLSVDRRTGVSRVKNLTSTEEFTLDGYLVTSPDGQLAPVLWTSFEEDGIAGFRESIPSNTHLGEVALEGSREIGPNSEVSLGAIYSPTSIPFSPTVDGDLAFEYALADGMTETGIVEYHGAHNNLVLVVNPNGQTYLQNQSTRDIALDGYLITSASGSLNEAGWTSLNSGNAAWTESNPADNHLGELNLDGSQLLMAESEAIFLGTAFDPNGLRDLNFTFHVAGEGAFAGIVDYDQGVIDFVPSLAGDYDRNGTVDAQDYVVWKALYGTTNLAADGNGDNVVDAADYVVWRNNFGNSSQGGLALPAAAVPEPATVLLLGLVSAAALATRAGRGA